MRLIDADTLWRVFKDTTWWDNSDRGEAQSLLEDAPTIDAVEVVRCKECKHWIIDDYWNRNPDQVRACRFAGWICSANGYCMYGERKIDAEVE